MSRVSVRPSHRNPEDLQPEACDLCGGLIGHVHLLEADVEGLRGFKVCDRHAFEAVARVTPSVQDYQRYGPGPFATDEARLEPIGAERWFASSPNYELDLDGVDDYANATFASPVGAMSLQVEFTLDTAASTLRYLAGWQNSAAAGARLLRLAAGSTNRLELAVINDGGTLYQVMHDSLAAADRYEATLVLNPDAGLAALYVDGEEVGSVAIAGSWSTILSSFVVGRRPDAANSFLPGQVRRVRIWSRALPQNLIQSFRGITLSPSAPGLISEWAMIEGEGTTAANVVTGAAALTLSSSALWAEVEEEV